MTARKHGIPFETEQTVTRTRTYKLNDDDMKHILLRYIGVDVDEVDDVSVDYTVYLDTVTGCTIRVTDEGETPG